MKKVVDYILDGNGIGFKWLLLFSCLVSIFFGVLIKNFGDSLVPSIQNTAQQILPIKVEEGRIVTPHGIDKRFKMHVSDELPEFELPFSINTTVDTLETKNLEPGIYLTRTAFYNVANGRMEVRELKGSFEIPQGDYSHMLKQTMTYLALISTIISVFICFVSFVVLALVCTLTAKIILKLFHKTADFAFQLRLSVCGIIFMYSLKYFVELTGAPINFWLIFTLIVLFQALFIYKGLPASEVQKESKK